MKITYVFLFISIVTLSAISQTNTLSRIVMSNTVNGVNDRAIVFHPDSNRLLMMLGGIVNPSANSYDVQMFMPGAGRWINFLPDSALYGVWADSTGYSRGQGVISGGFSWATVYQNGKSYLRPMLQHNVQSHIYNQYAYDSDSQKIYFYMSNYTFTYNCRTRLWDTLKTAVHPNQLSTALALQAGKNGVYWGALCYDPVNREVLYFGGGNSPAQNGHNGTWVFSTETKAWRQLTGAEPPPRCLSPMVYDPASKCIVLFGGDHFDYLTSDTWLYHCTTRTWERVTPAISPAPRAGHSMMYLPKSKTIAMLGGYDYDTGYGTYSYRRQLELWKYNVTGNSWVLIKQWPGIFNPQLRYKGPTLAAADADDNIYIVAEDTARYSSTPNFKTWRIDADGSVSDVNGTAALGVAAGKVTRRPYGFDPAWYSTSVPATDTAVSEASLRNMTPNVWINIKPPKKHTWTTFSDIVWGAIRFSPDHDVIMSFNGGHSSYSANQVHTYLPNQNRWKVGYSGENPINFEGASGYFPSHHSF
ncbi:MAG: hypothetical protein JNL74_05530, partial [Fibrobacteres bacterium]|nr:hypothetical protein [Fibrobacterota bacterium]